MLPATPDVAPFNADLLLGFVDVPTSRTRGAADAMLRDEAVLTYVEHLVGHMSGARSRVMTPSANDTKRISRVFRHIDATLSDPQSIDGLAEVAAMSKFHFLRTFQKIAGVTPYRYVLGRRLTRAAARIRQTEMPISEIAFGEGFGDLSTFNRQFRAVFRQSPAQYRKASAGYGSGG